MGKNYGPGPDEIFEDLMDFDYDTDGDPELPEDLAPFLQKVPDWLPDAQDPEIPIFPEDRQEEMDMDQIYSQPEMPRSYSPLRKLWCKVSRKTCAPGLTTAECIGMPREQLELRLRQAGFYKLRMQPEEDLSYRKRSLLDTVSRVSIDGQEDFRRKSEFPFDVPVEITFHRFRKAMVGFTPQQLKKTSVCDTKAYFLHQGFGVVKSIPIYDLKMGWLKIDGQVERVLIDGFDCFKAESQFPVDTEILIYYHTFRHSAGR